MNIKELKEIIELFESSNITDLELEREGVKIVLRKIPEGAAGGTIQAETFKEEIPPAGGEGFPADSAPPSEGSMVEIRTPMVGTFYRTPAPDAEPFVEVGDTVAEGDVICIIEAMKLMNEIKSEVSGRVVEILAENGQSVEFNQPLFRLEAD